ncbi:Xylosidase/arabinosidase [Pleurostoma richardsiae]|uniref:Xylosidase/arabinosidase n=1 Tax=Pleurostoma richardsiae TaxID=41990 RepID=A0AA38VJ76_9PEZI|nr:Xylosidase/arabinosidase [Pleurostoma richardsiae]
MGEMASRTVYRNPIIPGFAPDPSIVFVDGYFFLVTSSFHLFPALPIYVSKDLANWALIGNAINRKSQLDLADASTDTFPLDTGFTMIGTSGLFAPTIRHHNGVFYLVCTNTTSTGLDFETTNFYITTTDIWSSAWSEPIYIDFHGIDPSFFFDDDDRVYLQGSWRLDRTRQPSCTIKQYEIDVRTGEALSATREIWQGFAKYDSEGPHIYKKDGWYYLVIAEGGTFEHHMLSVARSRAIWGPYDSCEQNPIMTASGTNEYIQNIGHGELFQDGTGAWWAVVLGVRNHAGRYPLGRETFLTPVTWPKDGWPRVDQPRMLFERHSLGGKNDAPIEPATEAEYVFIRSPVLEDYQISSDGYTYHLRASQTDLSSRHGTTTFMGKRQRNLESSTSTVLHVDKASRGKTLIAGLALYKDPFRYAEIFFDYEVSSVGLRIHTSLDGGDVVVKSKPLGSRVEEIAFRVSATETAYEFSYQLHGSSSWNALGEIDSLDMTARDFTGTIIGLFATARGGLALDVVTFRGLVEAPNGVVVNTNWLH